MLTLSDKESNEYALSQKIFVNQKPLTVMGHATL